MGDSSSFSSILWSTDPATQFAILIVLGAAALAAISIFGPLILRLGRLFMLERRLRELSQEASEHSEQGRSDLLREAILDSPVGEAFEEFERRWTTSQLSEAQDRAPIRLMDVFDDRPLLAYGPRRSLIPVLPGLFLGLGVFAALTGLIPSLSGMGADQAAQGAPADWMAAQLGLALRASAWGFLCAIGASITGRLLEGGFIAQSAALDGLVEAHYGSVSPGELAEITRQTQQRNLDTLGKELSQFASELNERTDRGLQRIEQSTARAASLVSQEQRGALHTVVQELSLSVRQGVDHHLSELRSALQRTVEHQTSVTSGLAETFERMVENSHTQDRVARTLVEAAGSVEEASRMMHGSASEMQPVLEHLGTTSQALSETATRIKDTQQVVARTAEGVRSSLERAASGVDEQRKFMERSLAEIRRSLAGLGDGLGTSLQRSLREVDDVLGATVGQLRDTLAESNETIERLSVPIRAAEGSTRETHLALDRVRAEVEALGQWLTQASKPLRAGLGDVEARADDIARALSEFTNQTRQIDKTMEGLRIEIHDESRRLQGAGSDLGRRLSLTSDALGLLGGTSADPGRRARPEAGGETNSRPGAGGETNSRPGSAAASESTRDSAPSVPTRSPSAESRAAQSASPGAAASLGASYSDSSTGNSSREDNAPSRSDNAPSRGDIASSRGDKASSRGDKASAQSGDKASASSRRESTPASGANGNVPVKPRFGGGTSPSESRIANRTPAADAASEQAGGDSAGRDTAASGYRLGTPRAQGRDPYERFDSLKTGPSNVRHFPTPDRELGENLKLSGLLGPSGPTKSTSEGDPEDVSTSSTNIAEPTSKPTSESKSVSSAKGSSKPTADDAE